MMEFLVGTSGWVYSWNEAGSLDWYVSNSGLNAVELNMSFYRFPLPSIVKSWSLKGKNLRWSIKVNRLITHNFKFNERAFESWQRFHNLFLSLESYIDFYLFQLPPFMKPEWAERIKQFMMKTDLHHRFALEVRNDAWFSPHWIDWASRLGITWVSIDSPDLPRDIHNSSGLVYVRMHGRTGWYNHLYSEEELEEVARNVLRAKPKKVYVFFNNDHAMLVNSRRVLSIFSDLVKGRSD